jgi:hypothetical protein
MALTESWAVLNSTSKEGEFPLVFLARVTDLMFANRDKISAACLSVTFRVRFDNIATLFSIFWCFESLWGVRERRRGERLLTEYEEYDEYDE